LLRHIDTMKTRTDKEQQFLGIVEQCRPLIYKVCWLYTSPGISFDDLYQEVLINIWQGMDSFRGDSKMSTWIHRTAINTCISWYRRNSRHCDSMGIDELPFEPADVPSDINAGEMLELHRLISMLGPIDKAIITLWLDEKPYEEIAAVMGMSVSNVAVRLHRIKERLSKLADK